MNKRAKVLLCAGACIGVVLISGADVIVYSETFDNGISTDPAKSLTNYNWTAHYGSSATAFFPIPGGYAVESQPYVRGGGYVLDNKPGDGARTSVYSGSDPKLIWTTAIAASTTDVSRLTTATFNLARQAGVRFAVQVDDGTTWFLTQTVFMPSATRVMAFANEKWDRLTFDPGVSMSVGGATNLPAGGRVTAIGFYYQISEPTGVTQDLQLDTVAVSALEIAHPALLASESFWTTADGLGGLVYSPNIYDMNSATNKNVVLGTVGFVGTSWLTGNGRMRLSSTVSLSHPGTVLSTQPGSGRLNVSNFAPVTYRNSQRPLAAVPAVTNVYYLSGLIRVDALDIKTGEALAVGFDNRTGMADAITNGIHLGVCCDNGKTYLAAFAGQGVPFSIVELGAASMGQTYQVVLRLDASASGVDTLTGWYAAANATELTKGLRATPVETWSGAGTLQRFRLTTRAVGRSGTDADTSSYVYFDEVRMGAALAAVTALPEPAVKGTLVRVL